MLQKLLSTLSVVVMSATLMFAQNESAIKVKLTDKTTKETIPFANVIVEMGGIQQGVGTTNIDGEAMIKPLSPGKYNVKASYVGYQVVEVTGINVFVGKTVYLNLEMTAGQQLDVVEVITYAEPLIDPDTKSGGTVTAEEYKNMPTKNINSVAATTAGVYQKDEGGALNVRGARDNGTAYYVDGQRVIGSSNVPQSSVEQISTIIGGTPAEYGDATGGVVSITTKGPASKYTGGVELITSGIGEKKGLDAYGYNFIGFSVNGPILSKKDSASGLKKSILGFTVAGQLVKEKDPGPSAVGFYVVNSDKLADLENHPLRPASNGQEGFVLNSEFVTSKDLEKVKARPNVGSNSLLLNGKILYQPTNNMGITIGGSLDYNKRHDWVYEYALLNPVNFPQIIESTWRAYAKLTQKFNSASAKEEEKSQSIIKNAYFTLQASYAKNHKKTEDDTHKDNFFDYGYIGKFNQSFFPIYSDTTHKKVDANGDGVQEMYYGRFLEGRQNNLLTFTPGTQNPTGTPYTEEFYAGTNQFLINGPDDVQRGLGMLNGDRPTDVYSLWRNTGRQYNGYILTDKSRFGVDARFSADIQKHALQLGFEYEQRTEREYSLGPIGLWTQMRKLANSHLSQLDSIPILNSDISGTFLYYDYNRLNDGQQTQFDKSVRQKLGLNVNGTDYIDIDSYDPSFFTLDMFSADDLLNTGGGALVSYYGYDHTGKKINGNPSLDDFFNKKDDNGNYTRQVGAYRPIYIAGFIQDKFDFKDLKFNVGLRVDRFDANQKVLKDKYLLYEAKTAGEVTSVGGISVSHPSNIGSDYVVYVDDKDNPGHIVGYRDGDVWYNAQGTIINDPSVLATGGTINPYLVDPAAANRKEVTSKVFKDYTPQINFMPRIAFAFPISDVANFFAHYDVLTQRPPGSNRMDPLSYLNFKGGSEVIDNPNLKPERTTDYELGFAQVLTEKKNSVITLTAFYREFRDMIQETQVFMAYPATYTSFDNIDFGTSKGFSISYDLRRSATGVQLTANYTLTFADGTGSSTTDGVNLAASGAPNLRTTHPLDFDQRHTIVLNVDYRFGSGKDYNGPVWTRKKGDTDKSIKLLENVGANVVFRAGSGTPYSKQANISQEGSFGVNERKTLSGDVNGSNLPWNFKVDLRIDKDLELTWGGKKEGEEKKHANLNIYLQILNVLNTKNILAVYRATGNPDDDGYISSTGGQSALLERNSSESFTDLYNVKINKPDNYSRPRVVRLGLTLDF